MSSERSTTEGVALESEPFLYIAEPGDNVGGGDEGPAAWSAQRPAKPTVEQREKESYDRGVRDGEARARTATEQEILTAKGSIAATIEKFKKEREAYFTRIEPEVVKLALAIARKILHREAQMDPLLLAGMVRVALEKTEGGTRVRLWAHPADIPFWNTHFSQAGSSQPPPELVGDPALHRGECSLETEVGSTQISLEAQLKEIEQGFFDLLDQRPKVG